MEQEGVSFFATLIGAGSILSGFCGTFLAFRIQREASYFRQPAVSFEKAKAKDVHVGLTHFTSPMLLLGLATSLAMLFGFAIPLLALAGSAWAQDQVRLTTAGLIASVVFLGAYFIDELVHYQVLHANLADDAAEWGKEWVIVLVAVLGAAFSCFLAFRLL